MLGPTALALDDAGRLYVALILETVLFLWFNAVVLADMCAAVRCSGWKAAKCVVLQFFPPKLISDYIVSSP